MIERDILGQTEHSMSIDEYVETVEKLSVGEVEKTHDMKLWQTSAFPSKMCVNWEQGKAWLEPNEAMIEEDDDIEIYIQNCADYGIRDCKDRNEFNRLLEELQNESKEFGFEFDEDSYKKFDEYEAEVSRREAGHCYQFYAELHGSCPQTWRRFNIPECITFAEFGYILLTLFEMKGSHSFSFSMTEPQDVYIEMPTDDPVPGSLNAIETEISEEFFDEDRDFMFTYDFGDRWEFRVCYEGICYIPLIKKAILPNVFEGEGYGIIEDIGGVTGLIKHSVEIDLTQFDIDDMDERLQCVPQIFKKIYEEDAELTQEEADLLNRA